MRTPEYEVTEQKEILERDAEIDGVLKDEIIKLKTDKGALKARLITFKSLTTGKSYTFVSNLFDVAATTIAKLYKNRWDIEPFFYNSNRTAAADRFELKGFYSDSEEGIKTQVWIAMIANLIFTVIHRQIKQAKSFSTMVQMARVSLGPFIRYLDAIKIRYWRGEKKNIEKIQLDLFQYWEGVVFKT
jgi:hypothetical protein